MKRLFKIAVRIVAVLIAVPVLVIVGVLTWAYFSDRTTGSTMSSGVERRYVLYVPKSYDAAKPTPLVISIHPGGTWPAKQREISGWDQLADEKNFLVVYPAGVGAFFGGNGRGQLVWPGTPQDIQFISDLIDKLERNYNIDRARIYVNGMSNGGRMAFVVTCAMPERVAAAGIVSGELTISMEECGPKRPVPTMVFHGTGDKLAPYEGGTSPVAPGTFPNIPAWTAQLARRNGCGASPLGTRVSAHVLREAYTGCTADFVFYTIEGGGHTWPGGTGLPEWYAGPTTPEISATRLLWEFYEQHPLAQSAISGKQ